MTKDKTEKFKDFQKIGKQNKTRGDYFEKLVAGRAKVLGLDLLFKVIDRTHRRGVSLPDVESIDFPDLMIDCKFTEGIFSLNAKRKMLLECHTKYGGTPIVICGEKKDKTCLTIEDVIVCSYQQTVAGYMMVMYQLDEWLYNLHSIKQLKLMRRN